jgi:sortase A
VAVTAAGVMILWAALGLAGYAFGWQSHKSAAQSTLVRSEKAAIHKARQTGSHVPCVATASGTGQLAGLLEIPSLHLTAPVEEGTGDAQLSVAVGHDPSSVWPGQSGTSVLLAHDVSYFVHLDQLKPGQQIVFRTACTELRYTVMGQQIVQQGTPVPDSTTPSLVLDTCYPPNALFFTTQRLLVRAVEVGAGAAPDGPSTGSGRHGPGQTTYTVPAPPALVSQGLTLQQNEAPMGTMSLLGQVTPQWEQSPGPLALTSAALEAYFGGLHATAGLQLNWWAAIASPSTPPPEPLMGATVTGHDAPLDVSIRSTHGVATSVVLGTTVTISGGSAPGTYAETVTASVSGGTVQLAGWQLTPA